jgi:hypothetical protein
MGLSNKSKNGDSCGQIVLLYIRAYGLVYGKYTGELFILCAAGNSQNAVICRVSGVQPEGKVIQGTDPKSGVANNWFIFRWLSNSFGHKTRLLPCTKRHIYSGLTQPPQITPKLTI